MPLVSSRPLSYKGNLTQLPRPTPRQPPVAAMMRPRGIVIPSTSSSPSSRKQMLPPPKPALDPFVLHSQQIIRPSAPPSTSALPDSVTSLSAEPTGASTSTRYTRPIQSTRSAASHATPTSPRLLKRSSAVSRGSSSGTHGSKMHRIRSTSTSSVYSQCTVREDEKVPTHAHLPRKDSLSFLHSTLIDEPWLDCSPRDSLLNYRNTEKPTASAELPSSVTKKPPTPPQSATQVLPPAAFASAPTHKRNSSQPVRNNAFFPRTTSHLRQQSLARRRAPIPSLRALPSLVSTAPFRHSLMTRVDSQVLLARMALKRLGSTEFEGDALDRLEREPSANDTIEEGKDWWDDLPVNTLYRDSLYELDDPPLTGSDLSSATSWQWSRASASTSRTSLSMDALEDDLARLSKEFQDECGWFESKEGEEFEDDDNYVCALDLIQDDEEDEEAEPIETPRPWRPAQPRTPSPPPIPQAAPVTPRSSKIPQPRTSRLPRPKASKPNLRIDTAVPPTSVPTPRSRPSSPSAGVPRRVLNGKKSASRLPILTIPPPLPNLGETLKWQTTPPSESKIPAWVAGVGEAHRKEHGVV